MIMRCLRIIPDRRADNKQSHVLAAAMHDLYRSPLSRVDYTPMPPRIRSQVRFWYLIDLQPKSIRVYLASADGEPVAYLRQRMERCWPLATIEEELPPVLPTENTGVSQLHYRRHNLFALTADWREDTVPIADVLAVWRDLREGDRVMLTVCLQPYSRIAWSDHADVAQAKFAQGKTPKRFTLSDQIKPVAALTTLDDQIEDLRTTFLGGIDGKQEAKKRDAERMKRKPADGEKRALLQDGHLSPTSRRKPNQPCFKTWIWTLAHSADKARRQALLRSISNAFTGLSGDNELQSRPVQGARVARAVSDLQLPRWAALSPDATILSAEEVGKLLQIPTASLQDEYKTALQSVEHREMELPDWLTSGGIPLGSVTYKGRAQPVFTQVKDADTFCLPHFAFGPQGAGKSLGFAANMAVGAINNRFSTFLIDVADGELIDCARDALPDWMPDDHVIDLDFGHGKYAIPLTWSEIGLYSTAEDDPSGAANLLASQLVTFVDAIAKSVTTDRMSMYLKDAARARLGQPGATILDAMLMLTSKKYWTTHKRYVESARLRNKLEAYWSGTSETDRNNIVRPIQTRVSLLMDEERVADHTMQPDTLDDAGRPLIDFRRWMDGDNGLPYFVGIRIPKETFLERGTDALVTFAVSKLWLSTLTRYDTPKDERRPFVFLHDEPHQAPSSLTIIRAMVREARKWRQKNVWMGHTLEDFAEIMDVVQAAGCQYTQYKPKSPKSLRIILPELAPFTPEELYAIPDRGWAVNRVAAPGGQSPAPAFLAEMALRPTKVRDRSHLREQWAQALGRTRIEVRKMIAEKEAQYL